jgi:HSP20 family protein
VEDIMDSNSFKGFNFGGSFDDILRMAREFGEKFKDMAPDMGPIFESYCRPNAAHGSGPGPDFQQSYRYPPANIYTASDGSMVLEFALAGLDESAISVTFQGDFLVLSAKLADRDGAQEGGEGRYARHGFKPRDVERQKYFVSAEDYEQEQAKAVYRNGLLTVTIPPRKVEGIKIEIVKEGI